MYICNLNKNFKFETKIFFKTFVTGKQIFQFQRLKFEKKIEQEVEELDQIKIEDLRAI